MAAFWMQCDGEWGAMSLNAQQLELRDEPGAAAVRLAADDGAENGAVDPAVLVRVPRMLDGPWVLLAAPGSNVFVNGSQIFGMRILADKDEVRLRRQKWYFSTERLIRAEPFAGREGTCCALCRQPIVQGTMAVRCRCNLWFHQTEEYGCWLYADRCCGCESPTAIDAGFAWTPEGL